MFNSVQKRIEMFSMFLNGFGENKNIINVNNGEMGERVENIIHNILKFTRSILQFKRHNIPLIMTKWGSKGSLISITIIDLDLPKP
jgi:hypothetical protein